jgi:hypothetical protein
MNGFRKLFESLEPLTRGMCVCVCDIFVCVCLYIVVMFNREHTQTITTITTIAPTSWFCHLYPSIFNHIATEPILRVADPDPH